MRLSLPCCALAAMALLTAMAGCATPQYQTTVRLIPPADAQGRRCIQACEAERIACQTDCQTRRQACLKRLEPQVEARYLEALGQYELALRQYAATLRHYEMQLHFDWLHGAPFQPPYYGWQTWPGPYFPPPAPAPEMPTRDGIRAQLEKQHCRDDCGCMPAYDACFIGCGGQRVSETICIKNCPPE